jgi:signal transduction histidine kinase/Tfp pilus assembly protein PilF
MNMSKTSIFIGIIIFLNFFVIDVFNQSLLNLDSLEKILYKQVDDTAKVQKLILFTKECLKTNPRKALEYSNIAYNLSTKLRFTPGVIDAYYQMAAIYKLLGKPDSAKICINRSIDLCDSIQDERRLADHNSLLGTMIFKSESPDSAKYYFVKSLSVYNRLKDSTGMANSLNRIGTVFLRQSKYDSAVNCFLESLRLSEKLNYREGLGNAWVNLGVVYVELKEFKKAKSCLLKSIEINKVLNNLQQLSIAYNNLGGIADDEDDHDQALNYYNQALEICEKLGNLSGIANMKNNIANIYGEKEQYDKAFENYTDAKSIYTKIGNKDGFIAAFKNQALIYDRWKNYDRALKIFDSCLVLAKEINSPLRTREIYFNIYGTYERKKDFEKAYYYKTLHSEISDSIFNLEKSETITDLQLKYEKEKDQSRILSLENETLAKSLDLKKRTNQRNGYLYSGLGLVLVISFIFIFYRHKDRKDKIIAAQKISQLEEEKKLLAARSIVEGQEEERKRIAKDLHDGLGVLLSAVKMQFSSIKDKSPENKPLIERATKLLEQASGDVRKISHNMMPGLLTKFGLYEAVEDLFENLDETEGLTAELKIEGETSRLPENKEIMLYRIVQELVNNTLKHAGAKNIKLNLEVRPNRLNILYMDDGHGFNVKKKLESKSIGLTSIQSRVKFISGELSVKSEPGKGVTFEIWVPLP